MYFTYQFGKHLLTDNKTDCLSFIRLTMMMNISHQCLCLMLPALSRPNCPCSCTLCWDTKGPRQLLDEKMNVKAMGQTFICKLYKATLLKVFQFRNVSNLRMETTEVPKETHLCRGTLSFHVYVCLPSTITILSHVLSF